MKQAISEILSVVVSHEDRGELANIVAKSEAGSPVQPGSSPHAKESVSVNGFSPTQRLLLAAYAHLYAALQSRDLEKDIGLVKCRSLLNIDSEFGAHVARCLRSLDKSQLLTHATPLGLVLSPPPQVVEWANAVVFSAHRDSDYARKRRFSALVPAEYEHALDRQYLNALRGTMGLDSLVRKFYEWGLEPLLQVQYTGSNLKITAESFPQAFRALERACEVLGVAVVPDAFIDLGFINALTIGAQKPIVILSSGCFAALSYDELMFIIGHELGHIMSEHCLYHTLEHFHFICGVYPQCWK